MSTMTSLVYLLPPALASRVWELSDLSLAKHREVSEEIRVLLGEGTVREVCSIRNNTYVGYVAKDGEAAPDGLVEMRNRSSDGHRVFSPGGRKLKARKVWEDFFAKKSGELRRDILRIEKEVLDAVDPDGVCRDRIVRREGQQFLVVAQVLPINKEKNTAVVMVPIGHELPPDSGVTLLKEWEWLKLVDDEEESRRQ
jgi:hypothetical protein